MEVIAHILRKQFRYIHGLLQSTFLAPTYKEREGWSYEAAFQHATIFMIFLNIQIHHNGNIHWIGYLLLNC